MTARRDSGHSPARASSKSNASLQRYTLHRDGDRDLQFDGTEVAAFEAGDHLITHRVAIYRTRGSKYVAEFATRPNPVPSPFRDPPERLPTTAELAEYKENLITEVLDTAEWREAKAVQFPSDHRNSESAESLRGLASGLDEVPTTDPHWSTLWVTENDIDERSVGHVDTIFMAQNRAKNELIRNYGFGSTYTGLPYRDALNFLDDLSSVLRDAVLGEIERPETSAKSKAQAFDTLDEAIAWFRPGHLTTELLRLLGRIEPEFIE